MPPRITSARLRAVIAFVAGASVFVTVHLLDHWRTLERVYGHIRPEYRDRIPSAADQMAGFGIMALALYAGYALIGMAIAAKTRDKLLWALPATMFVLGPAAGGVVGLGLVHPQPLMTLFDGSGIPLWAQALIDLVLVLAPGAVVAFRRQTIERRVDWYDRASFGAVAALGVWLYMQSQYAANGSFDVNLSAHLHLAVLFIAGVSLGVRRPWFPFVHLAGAFLLSEAPSYLVMWLFPFDTGDMSAWHIVKGMFLGASPQLMAVGLGALCLPLRSYVRNRRSASAPEPAGAQERNGFEPLLG